MPKEPGEPITSLEYEDSNKDQGEQDLAKSLESSPEEDEIKSRFKERNNKLREVIKELANEFGTDSTLRSLQEKVESLKGESGERLSRLTELIYNKAREIEDQRDNALTELQKKRQKALEGRIEKI